jgi:hypothetical protein
MTSDSFNELRMPADSEPKPTLEAYQELASDSELLAVFVKTRNRNAAEQLVQRHGAGISSGQNSFPKHSYRKRCLHTTRLFNLLSKEN